MVRLASDRVRCAPTGSTGFSSWGTSALLLSALGVLPGGDLHAPAQAVPQQIQAGQGGVHAEALLRGRGDAGQGLARVGPAPRRRAGVPQRLQLLKAARG